MTRVLTFADELRQRIDRQAEKLRAEIRHRQYDRALDESESGVTYEDGVLTGYEQAIEMLDELIHEMLDE